MISIMIASRNRVDWLDETIKSIYETADTPENIEIIVRYDDDDAATHEYVINHDIIPLRKVRDINKARFFNEMTDIATFDILGGFSDDFRFRTKGWDTFVIQAYKICSPLAVIWGRDGIQDENLTTHFFCTKQWKELFGYIWVESLPVAYCDNWMLEVIKGTPLAIYNKDLYFEHLHPFAGKAPNDLVYSESHCKTHADMLTWNASQHLVQADREKLIQANQVYANY